MTDERPSKGHVTPFVPALKNPNAPVFSERNREESRARIVPGKNGNGDLPPGYRLWVPADAAVPDPVLDRAAYLGPIGEYLDLLAGKTEAHPAAAGYQCLAMLGTVIGRRATWKAERVIQHCNLFGMIVGPSSEGAKSSADAEALYLMRALYPEFLQKHGMGGHGSGEVIVRELADNRDPAPVTNRIVMDAELSAVLTIAKRDGSTLGQQIRRMFDYQPLRHSTVSGGTVVATNHHISLTGSITPEELHALISNLDLVSGLANRFLFIWSRIAMYLPEGAAFDAAAFGGIVGKLETAFDKLRTRTEYGSAVYARDPAARELWDAFYRERRTGHGEGIAKALSARHVTHAARLALIYAVLDGAVVIGAPHIEAATAWCDYSDRTVRKVWGGPPSTAKADVLLAAIRNAMPEGLTGNDLNRRVSKSWKAGELDAARDVLVRCGEICRRQRTTSGRSADCWLALSRVEDAGAKGARP